jgi:hypothetical protein
MAIVLGLVAASCSTGGGDAATSTSIDNVQGGPTTSQPLGATPKPIPDGIRIEVLSSQPDRVTGSDARIRISPARGGQVADLSVVLGDVDVTGQFGVVDGALEGVLDGLIEGNNTLKARDGAADPDDPASRAVQRIRAWPITGPVFSGPHLPLLACSTEEAGLGTPTDADCSAPTKVTWRYIATDGALRDLPDGAGPDAPPGDLDTAEIAGDDVPLYVRVEKGVINRSVYELASIDLTPGDDDPTGPDGNRRFLYRFGGGCGTTYGQGTSLTTAQDPAYLAKGYVVATATFNTFQVQCNDVLSAETALMVKERAIELFGKPDFTIGEGASGGAIQLHLLAQNYPGIVNGAVAALPFPDAVSISPGVTDCGLLLAYYRGAGASLSPAQRRAINGHASPATCQTWAASFLPAIDPQVGCDPKIPADAIYDPDRNPGGLRCTLQDANRYQLGRDDETGWARRPLDNIGIQYGLQALNDETISVDQFLDLNEGIGGYDLDGQVVDERHEADPEAVLHVYETGRVAMGTGDLTNIPIIDLDLYTDPLGDIHDRFRAFSLRDRLAPSGDPEEAPGFQIWTLPAPAGGLIAALANATSATTLTVEAVDAMDRWLTALLEDRAGGPLVDVLRRTRPADAVDRCVRPERDAPLVGAGTYADGAPCADDYPLANDPRTAAGAPRSNEILKCTLKAPDLADYEVRFSDAQRARLFDIFATGVCNWDLPGVGAVSPATPDRTYEEVPSPGRDA